MSNKDKILTEMGEYAAIVHEGEPEMLYALFDDPQCDQDEYLDKLERALQLIYDSSDTHFLMTNHREHGKERTYETIDEFGDQMKRVLILERMRYDVLGVEWEPYRELDGYLSGYHIRQYHE